MRSLVITAMVAALHGMVLVPWGMAAPSVSPPQAAVVRVTLVQGTPEATRMRTPPVSASEPARREHKTSKAAEKASKPAPETQVPPKAAQQGNADKSVVTQPVPADYAHNPPPVYPREARLRRMQGVVLLEVWVKADGGTKQVRVHRSSGYPVLDDAAVKAVRQWSFIPARMGNETVEAKVMVPVAFRLQ